MKTFNKILIATGFAGLLAGCTDLDTPIDSLYTEYPNTEVAVEGKLSDVYFHLRGTFGRRYMEAQALSSDEWVGISFDGDYYDSGTYAHASLHNFSPDDASLGWYEDVSNGIAKANKVIQDVGGNHAKAAASARAIRAFYHWILMDSYGDCPILNEVMNDSAVVERQPRKDVAKFITDELEEIIPQLTTTVDENTYGKPTRYMAEALLAKVLINWPVYTADKVENYDASTYKNDSLQRVVTLCDDIINSGKFDLSDSYLSKFYPNNGSQIKDFIYAMPFDKETQTGFQYGRPRAWRKANTGTSYFGTTLSKSCGGNFSITPEASDRLMALSKDDRQGHVLGDTIYMYDPTTYAKTKTQWSYKDAPVVLSRNITLKTNDETLNVGNDTQGFCQGYKSVKWFIIDDDYSHDRNQSNDLPIFRLADIILVKAEAIARGANGDKTAEQLIQQIRDYVHADKYVPSNSILTDILDERGRELFDENWRRNDMIRFGTFESDYGFHKHGFPTARFNKGCRIFPIPTSVLNKNTNWEQNSAYQNGLSD